jgi:hypothetical protein
MMALAEVTSPLGTPLGAIITVIFYGVAPVALVMYLLGTPGRRRARLKAEAEAHAQHQAKPVPELDSTQTNAGGLTSGTSITAVREETGGV